MNCFAQKMKYLLLFSLAGVIFAQDVPLEPASGTVLSVSGVDSATPANHILGGCEVFSEEQARYFSSDVFEAYQLENEYTTPLQREQYTKTEAYVRQATELRNAQKAMASKVFCLPMGRLEPYDTRRRGFLYKSSDINVAEEPFRQKNVLWSYDVAVSVPGVKKVLYPNPYNWHYEFFLSVPSNLALEIEKDPKAEFYVAVKLTGIKRHSTGFGYRHSSQHFITAKFIRFIVANAEEGRVYWSK